MPERVYVPYSDRPDWADVEPVPQDDGDNPPVPIRASPPPPRQISAGSAERGCAEYTARFSDAMDYFRAVVRSEEKSQRVLDLTTDVIAINSANYTAWHYRALVCDAIGADWDEQYRWVRRHQPRAFSQRPAALSR